MSQVCMRRVKFHQAINSPSPAAPPWLPHPEPAPRTTARSVGAAEPSPSAAPPPAASLQPAERVRGCESVGERLVVRPQVCIGMACKQVR